MHRRQLVQDRYELFEPIGRGGMAEVWRARDRRLARDVAVKFLAPQLADNPDFLVRFFTEAQSVARISSHPAVVDVLDFGQHDEQPFLVMEYAPGGPVSDLLVDQPLLPERAVEIVSEASRGLEAAHAHGLVHRDIKPGNILLDRSGRAKIADFGIAWTPTGETLTNTGATIGTPYYLAPEQVSGGEATPRSDVYAMGVVLYELLAGRRPFEGENVTAVAIARIDQEPPPPSTHNPDVGPEIDAVVMRCLSRDAASRFASAGALADDLDRIRSGSQAREHTAEGLLAAAPGGIAQPRFLAAGVVVLILLSLATAGVIVGTSRIDAPDPGGSTAPRNEIPRVEPAPTPSPLGETIVPATRPAFAPREEDEDEEKEKVAKTKPGSDASSDSPTPEPSGAATSPEPEDTDGDEADEGDGADPSPTPRGTASTLTPTPDP